MAITRYNIVKWYKMLSGKSIRHVNQTIGTHFAKDKLLGYYNNLTEKVTWEPSLLSNNELPTLKVNNGKTIYFAVGIFQYGLGAYDLYLKTGEDIYLRKFMQCATWAIDHQESSGAWDNFSFLYPHNPYGAMAQGEAASLLLRAYKHTGDDKYLRASQMSVDFMLKPLTEGGTAVYEDGRLVFMEYTHWPVVLNGWIFAWWGLYDYVLVTKDQGHYRKLLDLSCHTMEQMLPSFDIGYWSLYDIGGRMASPFYHRLHLAQLQAMYQLTGHDIFAKYANQWSRYNDNRFFKVRAFLVKAWQKVCEKE